MSPLARNESTRHDDEVARTPSSSADVRLDDVSKAIIEQLQEDGRQPYATLAKRVGLSEAAVRQRVQRLLDQEVMQIVAASRSP